MPAVLNNKLVILCCFVKKISQIPMELSANTHFSRPPRDKSFPVPDPPVAEGFCGQALGPAGSSCHQVCSYGINFYIYILIWVLGANTFNWMMRHLPLETLSLPGTSLAPVLSDLCGYSLSGSFVVSLPDFWIMVCPGPRPQPPLCTFLTFTWFEWTFPPSNLI